MLGPMVPECLHLAERRVLTIVSTFPRNQRIPFTAGPGHLWRSVRMLLHEQNGLRIGIPATVV